MERRRPRTLSALSLMQLLYISIIASWDSLPPFLLEGATRLLLRLGPTAPGLLNGLAALRARSLAAALARRAAARSAWSSLSPKLSSAVGEVNGLFGARREVVRRGVLIACLRHSASAAAQRPSARASIWLSDSPPGFREFEFSPLDGLDQLPLRLPLAEIESVCIIREADGRRVRPGPCTR